MNHDEKVREIVGQVKGHVSKGLPLKINKAVVSHFVPNPNDTTDRLPKIDLSQLTSILEIDETNKTCVAESGVTFSDLVEETVKHGLAPYVVPELRGITIGGAVSGCSVESMSYKCGGFHDTCLEYEVVDGLGRVISCSSDSNPELFHMLHGSYGTLGLITKIKFRLMQIKPFVRMHYRKFNKFSDYKKFLYDRCEADDYDFVDGIIHGKDLFVACLGKMVDQAPYVSSYNWLKIYYKSTMARKEDYLTISDYFFRYDTECHWLTRTVPLLETVPMRLLLGKMVLGSTNLIKWSKRLRRILRLKRRPDVVVDVFIPARRFGEFYDWYEDVFDFYPLWIVPYRMDRIYPWINENYAKGLEDKFFIDCAVYGKPNNKPDIDYSEVLEKKTHELNGIKTLISRNHYDEGTFWQIYNKNGYKKIKSETDPNGLFYDLYEKFSNRV